MYYELSLIGLLKNDDHIYNKNIIMDRSMTDADPVVDNTWSTTQQNRLEEARGIPEKII